MKHISSYNKIYSKFCVAKKKLNFQITDAVKRYDLHDWGNRWKFLIERRNLLWRISTYWIPKIPDNTFIRQYVEYPPVSSGKITTFSFGRKSIFFTRLDGFICEIYFKLEFIKNMFLENIYLSFSVKSDKLFRLKNFFFCES